jgi:tripartite-type tricarboxylate transporter receptor subunit TctC
MSSITRLTALAMGASLCLVSWQTVAAENKAYPSRPITVIIPTSAGGGTDLSFRVLAGALEPVLKQKILVVNKPADSGVEGLAAIAKAAPDGYTLGASFNGPLTASPLVRKMPYTLESFTYIASTFESDYLLCARKDFPAADGPQLVSLVRQKPLGFSYANDGRGGSGYFAAEGLFDALGMVLKSESFNGTSDAAKAFVAGKADLYIGTVPPILEQLKSGEVKCPVTLGGQAPDMLPSASTPAVLGAPGKEVSAWRLVIGPKGMPQAVAAKLEGAIRTAMKSAAVRAFLDAQSERASVQGEVLTAARLKQELAANAELADRLLLNAQ